MTVTTSAAIIVSSTAIIVTVSSATAIVVTVTTSATVIIAIAVVTAVCSTMVSGATNVRNKEVSANAVRGVQIKLARTT